MKKNINNLIRLLFKWDETFDQRKKWDETLNLLI